MKNIFFGIAVGFLFLLSGCLEDEGYSLNNVWIGFGIVENSDSYKIIMDDGEILIPLAFAGYGPYYDYSYSGKPNQKIEKGDRLLVNFTILDEKVNESGKVVAYYVKINSTRKILTKGILEITEANKDSIGSDPIMVKDCWMANGLLNFKLKYYGRNQVHFINLVKEPGKLTTDNQPFNLELRHNNNNDSEVVLYTAHVSFRLDSLQVAGTDSVKFKVTSKDYEGKLFEFEGTYKYGKNN